MGKIPFTVPAMSMNFQYNFHIKAAVNRFFLKMNPVIHFLDQS